MALTRTYFLFFCYWIPVRGQSFRPLGVTSLRTSPYVTPQHNDFADMTKSIIMRVVDKIPDVTIQTNGSAKIVYGVAESMTGTKYEVCVNHCPRLDQDDLSTIWKNGALQANMVRRKGFQTVGTYRYRLIVNPSMLHIRVQALDYREDAHTTVTWTEEEERSEISSIKYIGIETLWGTTAFKIDGSVDVMAVGSSSAEGTTALNGNETATTDGTSIW